MLLNLDSKHVRMQLLGLCLVFSSLGFLIPSAAADDHERVRGLVDAGEIMPLQDVLEIVQGDQAWRLIEAELEREDGSWIYEFEFIDEEGRILEMEVDALDGTLIEMEIEDK